MRKIARYGLLAFSMLLWLSIATFYAWALWQSWQAMHRPLPPAPPANHKNRGECNLDLMPPDIDMRRARELPPMRVDHA